MLLYALFLRLYGYLFVHLFGLWIFIRQVASFSNGQPPKRFNFVRQEQKVFIVTGGIGGIGRKITERLMSLGALVIITGRKSVSDSTLKKIFEDLSTISSKFRYFQVEFGSISETVQFGEMIRASFKRLDGLVCNAGIMGTSYHLTPEGFELQQTVNYLSSVILVDQLKLMLKETQGRIILVSSAVHRLSFCNLDDFMFRNGYCAYLAYAQSKLALVSFTHHKGIHLWQQYGITLNSVHPGIVNTNLYRNPFVRMFATIAFMSPVTAAETILFPLLSTTFEGITGQYMENCEILPPAKKARDPKFCENLHKLTTALLSPWLSSDSI